MFDPIDWAVLFAIDTPLLEIFVRGTCVYLALLVLMRVVNRRQSGGLGMNDLLVIVIIADAAQNALAGEYKSITDGILLVAVIFFWDWLIDLLTYHWPWFDKLLSPDPVQLIKHGKVLHKNLRQQLLTTDELKSQLRLKGVDELKQVKCAYLEADGDISVVTHQSRTEAARCSNEKAQGAD